MHATSLPLIKWHPTDSSPSPLWLQNGRIHFPPLLPNHPSPLLTTVSPPYIKHPWGTPPSTSSILLPSFTSPCSTRVTTKLQFATVRSIVTSPSPVPYRLMVPPLSTMPSPSLFFYAHGEELCHMLRWAPCYPPGFIHSEPTGVLVHGSCTGFTTFSFRK
jgi:hypothetical protein